MGQKNPGGHLSQRVGFADYFHHLQSAVLGVPARPAGSFAPFIVEALDDAFGVLEILARSGDHDAVGFAIQGNRCPPDGLIAGVELHHGIGDDTDHLGRIGIGQAKDPRTAGGFRGLIQAFHDLGDEGDLFPGSGDDHTIGRRVGHDAALGDVLCTALTFEQVGGEGGGQGGQRRRVGLLEFDDLHLAGLHVGGDVQFTDDFGRGFYGFRFAGDHQAVASRIDQHLHGLGLGADALFHEAGNFRGDRCLETDDAGLLLGALLTRGIQLPDDGLNAGDFPLGAADHDAVVLCIGHEGGGAAGGLIVALDLLQIELLHQRGQFGRVSVVQFDVAELTADRRGCGGVELLDQGPHPLDVGVGGQHDDLLARGVRNELGLELGIARLLAQLAHHLSSQGDEFGGGLAVDRDDGHLALLAFRGEVHHGQDRFDFLFLFFGGRDQQPVVGIVRDHRGLRLVLKTPVGHALVDETVEAGEGGLQSCMAQCQDVQ